MIEFLFFVLTFFTSHGLSHQPHKAPAPHVMSGGGGSGPQSGSPEGGGSGPQCDPTQCPPPDPNGP